MNPYSPPNTPCGSTGIVDWSYFLFSEMCSMLDAAALVLGAWITLWIVKINVKGFEEFPANHATVFVVIPLTVITLTIVNLYFSRIRMLNNDEVQENSPPSC
jgi:uncharacterized membrane protein YhdT